MADRKISADPVATLASTTKLPVVSSVSGSFVNQQTTVSAIGAALSVGGVSQVTNTATASLINGTYTPSVNGGPISLLLTGSTVLPATNTGIRKALLTLFSSDLDDYDSAAIHIEHVQTSHPVPGSLARTGISVNTYTEPDDGGDTSGVLIVSTGGGNAISAYKTHLKRPTGYTNYQSAAGGAAEFGTADQYFAVNVVAGAQIGGAHTNRSTGLRVRIDNAASDGIMVEPGGAGVFDTRYAFLTGQLQTNSAPINVKCFVYLNGDGQFARLAAGAVGGAVSPGVSVGGQATTFAASGYSSLDGVRVKGSDAANTIFQSNANALSITTNTQPLYLGADVGAKHLRISTVGNVGVGTETFGTNAVGVLAIANGTAPTTGPADTVQFYSSDNSAGNTIPSFMCEGTEVLATGQADSASSVRVKVRVNGTVVTLLAI